MDPASLAALLLMALALAAQPWSVLAGIILVTTRGGLAKELAYVVGWVAALSVVMAVTIAMAPDAPKAGGSTLTAGAEIVLGLAVGTLLLLRWRRTTGSAPESPEWMGRLDSMPWILALALGAFLPNYVVVVAAATQMLQVGLSGGALVAAGAVFVIVASLGVAAPLGVLAVRRDRAPDVYARWRDWILGHNREVSYGMGAVVALVLVVKGLWGLAT
ncbi:MAG TPA: GAP family protein [Candidatus Nanopelagicales bacterium]